MLKRYNPDFSHVIEYEPIEVQPDLRYVEQLVKDSRPTGKDIEE